MLFLLIQSTALFSSEDESRRNGNCCMVRSWPDIHRNKCWTCPCGLPKISPKVVKKISRHRPSTHVSFELVITVYVSCKTILFDSHSCWSGRRFDGPIGMAYVNSMCSNPISSCGVNVDGPRFLPAFTASIMAHEMGHNFGLHHDQDYKGCNCQDGNNCIMAASSR